MKWYKVKDLESGRLKVTEEIAKKINREFGFNYRWVLLGEEPKEKFLLENELIATINTGHLFDIYDAELPLKLAQARKKAVDNRPTNLTASPGLPIKTQITLDVYFHNSETIAAAFARADGKCEVCGVRVPDLHVSGNRPFLEIHHVKESDKNAAGTPDDIEIVCPNCHLKIHGG